MYVVRLGANVGTKVKREQVAVLDPVKHEHVAAVLAQVLVQTPAGSRVFPFSYTRYRLAIVGLSESLDCGVKYSPHSMRAGFASEAIARGGPPEEVKRQGRWASESSFRPISISCKLPKFHRWLKLLDGMMPCHLHTVISSVISLVTAS